MSQEPSPSIAGLAWTFLRIGAMAFGGLGATLALIERELVSRQGVLARDALTESLTYTKLLPGSTVVQVVSYLGWRLGGWRGSAVATAAFLLPSAIAMLALSYGYTQLARAPAAGSGVRGMLAVVVGLLLVTRLASAVRYSGRRSPSRSRPPRSSWWRRCRCTPPGSS